MSQLRESWDQTEAAVHRRLSVCVCLCLSDRVCLSVCAAVSQLRESWDQTEAAVHRRLSQLETARLDSASWEAGRAELAAWLTRMEVRLDQLPAMGHTADRLEAQIREQKVRATRGQARAKLREQKVRAICTLPHSPHLSMSPGRPLIVRGGMGSSRVPAWGMFP